jgi:hypothetical protein
MNSIVSTYMSIAGEDKSPKKTYISQKNLDAKCIWVHCEKGPKRG